MIFCKSSFGGPFGLGAVLWEEGKEDRGNHRADSCSGSRFDRIESTDRRALFYGASMNPSWYVDGCARGNADWFSPRTAALPWYYWYGFRM